FTIHQQYQHFRDNLTPKSVSTNFVINHIYTFPQLGAQDDFDGETDWFRRAVRSGEFGDAKRVNWVAIWGVEYGFKEPNGLFEDGSDSEIEFHG
ncbi:hypothetical protein M8C21_032742, partial [Ambrosia artemisiifolia]